MLRLPRRLTSLALLVTSLAGGPGLAGLEAYEHAHRLVPGHGHRIHFERRGGQDHDDGCGAWLVSSPQRAPAPPATSTRLADAVTTVAILAPPTRSTESPPLLPPSRAPPATV